MPKSTSNKNLQHIVLTYLRDRIGNEVSSAQLRKELPELHSSSVHTLLSKANSGLMPGVIIQRTRVGYYRVVEVLDSVIPKEYTNGNTPSQKEVFPAATYQVAATEYFKIVGLTGGGDPVVVSQNGIVYKLVEI